MVSLPTTYSEADVSLQADSVCEDKNLDELFLTPNDENTVRCGQITRRRCNESWKRLNKSKVLSVKTKSNTERVSAFRE